MFGRVLRPAVRADVGSDGARSVIDLRSLDELEATPHPLAHIAAYRNLPLIDPAAEAHRIQGAAETLGEIY
jgi:protein-tyrosine phosphatase